MSSKEFEVKPMSDKQARHMRELANNDRKRGTPKDMVIAAKVDEAVSRHTIIPEN